MNNSHKSVLRSSSEIQADIDKLNVDIQQLDAALKSGANSRKNLLVAASPGKVLEHDTLLKQSEIAKEQASARRDSLTADLNQALAKEDVEELFSLLQEHRLAAQAANAWAETNYSRILADVEDGKKIFLKSSNLHEYIKQKISSFEKLPNDDLRRNLVNEAKISIPQIPTGIKESISFAGALYVKKTPMQLPEAITLPEPKNLPDQIIRLTPPPGKRQPEQRPALDEPRIITVRPSMRDHGSVAQSRGSATSN